MKFVLKPSSPSDFDTARSFYGAEQGDLVAAAAGIAWPVEPNDLVSAKARAEWSCAQQKSLVENNPTVRLVKVVDEDKDDEIIASGRWHRYPAGYEHIGDLEASGLMKREELRSWPSGLNKELYCGFLDTAFNERREWMGEGHYWVLTNIATREPFRRQGVGSLIIEWGLKQAADEGVPAYLEAAAGAKSLYEKHGFREIGAQNVDCTPYGLEGVKFVLARMRADPK